MPGRIEWLDEALAGYREAEGVSEVWPLDESSAVGASENYTGSIRRVRVRLRFRDAREETRSFVFKLAGSEDTVMLIVYETELKNYQKALSQMERLMNDRGLEWNTLWPKLVGFRFPDVIGLEDLEESGYKMVNRKSGLDKSHAELALRSLARFHAMSKVCIEKGWMDTTIYRPTPFSGASEVFNDIIIKSLSNLKDLTVPHWEDEYRHKYSELLEKLPDVIVAKLKNLFNGDRPRFKVFNHGDPWSNNMMFKYDHTTRQPISLKFVDFQLPHYSSFAMDVNYLIGTSLTDEARSNEDELMSVYQSELSSSLKACGYDGEAPTLESVREEIRETEFFRFFAAAIILPVVCAEGSEPGDTPDTVTAKERLAMGLKRGYGNKTYARRILDVFETCSQRGVFDGL